mmetsp:Transcript_44380/g.108455  ORF Transcript_44380/g.108455 Transcript_44380/m.108455 type:complete len:273 (-) Transcript_44380:214-1032(-)
MESSGSSRHVMQSMNLIVRSPHTATRRIASHTCRSVTPVRNIWAANTSSPAFLLRGATTVTKPPAKATMTNSSEIQRCATMSPYLGMKASSMGAIAPPRWRISTFLFETRRDMSSERAPRPVPAWGRRTSEAMPLRASCLMRSPVASLRETVLSSDTSASWLSVFHHPPVIFFVCLPSSGVIRVVRLLYSTRLPLPVPTASSGPTALHLIQVRSRMLVSTLWVFLDTASQKMSAELFCCIITRVSPSESQSIPRIAPPAVIPISSTTCPYRS